MSRNEIQSLIKSAGHFRLLLILIFLIGAVSCIPPSKKQRDNPFASTESNRQLPQNKNEEPYGNPTDAIVLAKTFQAKVVGVHDGDTITVLDDNRVQHKIRLSGIDSPELGQDFGRNGKENLSNLVFAKTVTIIHDKVDRYGRLVAKVVIDGVDANLAQVQAGLAWHFKQYEKEQTKEDRAIYAAEEVKAKNDRQGLWINPNPVPPWEHRANKRGRVR